MRSRLIVAVDTAAADQARAWADALQPYCGMFKLGLEFFAANGPAGVRDFAAAASARPIFLDLKLHDIPNTVARAVQGLLPLRPHMLTVHAAGGAAMIAAARAAADAAGADRPMLLAVTVLTSLKDGDLAAAGVTEGAAGQVLRLARLAVEAGADGVVCSPQEVAAVREGLGPKPCLVVPGIRPAGTDANDQARTTTPAEALAAGADWLVVGRPITGAPDPAAAAARIAAAMS